MRKTAMLPAVLCLAMALSGHAYVNPDYVLFAFTSFGPTVVREGSSDSLIMVVRADTLVVDSVEIHNKSAPQVDCELQVTFYFRYEHLNGFDSQIVVTESSPFRRRNSLRPFVMSLHAADSIGEAGIIDEFSIEALSGGSASEGDSLSGRMIFHYWRSTGERAYYRDTLDVIGSQDNSLNVREAGGPWISPSRNTQDPGHYDLLGRKAGSHAPRPGSITLIGNTKRTLNLSK